MRPGPRMRRRLIDAASSLAQGRVGVVVEAELGQELDALDKDGDRGRFVATLQQIMGKRLMYSTLTGAQPATA
jgi:hypothetical protein